MTALDRIFSILAFCAAALTGAAQEAYRHWVPDYLGDSIEMRYVRHPNDYQGRVRSTIIRRLAPRNAQRGVLYVHGYNDYFFQREEALEFNRHGYDFYAVDLRRYGRSLLPGQKAFDARDLAEYFPDIDSALVEMRRAGVREIALMGHSTGGLLCAYYLARGAAAVPVRALVLNSPFMDWNLGSIEWLAGVVSAAGYLLPDLPVPQGKSDAYSQSLLLTGHGEWLYNTDWKKPVSPAVSAGWIRAINTAQNFLHKADRPIRVPILLMYSGKGYHADGWTEECNDADIVLDPSEIRQWGVLLGTDVTCVRVDGGLHDLLLSRPGLRRPLYAKIFAWLGKRLPQRAMRAAA